MRLLSILKKRKKLFIVLGVIAAILLAILIALLVILINPQKAFIRVNTLGYGISEMKTAVIMTTRPITNKYSLVVVQGSEAIHTDTVNQQIIQWNQKFKTYTFDFTVLTVSGTYHIELKEGGVTHAKSVDFQIFADMASTYSTLVDNTLFYFQVQRDGSDVRERYLQRKPSHLADAQATIYNDPSYNDGVLEKDLESKGLSPVDVSGGWSDAGDYLKFTATSSYVVEMMLLSYRDYQSRLDSTTSANLLAEGKFGLEWLSKMWDENRSTLYYQVGLGNGNDDILSDHDLWRLPQDDDSLNVESGDSKYYVKYRPVFETEAGTTSQPSLSPNLAGKLASCFALCAQIYNATDSNYADDCLKKAVMLYSLADKSPSSLVTASPFDFYPEGEWVDDMEMAAVQLFLATKDPSYLAEASHWAEQYIDEVSDSKEVVNLYDVSGLAHYEYVKAVQAFPDSGANLEVSADDVIESMESRIMQGLSNSTSNPFSFAQNYETSYDLVPHTFGYLLEASFYDELVSTTNAYSDLVISQRDWLLGVNAWGTSFIIGAGTVYPQCPQHQIANLVGSLKQGDGKQILKGGVVDGPSAESNFYGLELSIDGSNPCPSDNDDPYDDFDGKGVKYLDNVASWPSVEPANDYTATSLYAFARLAAKN